MAGKVMKLETFFGLISDRVSGNSSPEMARKYWNAFYDVLLQELHYNGYISIYEFGKFEAYEHGGFDRMVTDFQNGGTKRTYVPLVDKLKFEPSSVLLKSMNENNYERTTQKRRKRKYARKEDLYELRKVERREKKKVLTMEEVIVRQTNKKIAQRSKEKTDATKV